MKRRTIIKAIIFYTITLILGTYIVFSTFATHKQTINVFFVKGFRVGTPSMEPYLMTNDVVFAYKVKEKNLNKGDIITFETYVEENGFFGKVVVTHYIGDIQEKDGKIIYKTQGHRHLNTENYDEQWLDKNKVKVEITYEDVIGKYAFKIPWIGHLILIIQNIFRNPVLLGLIALNIGIIYTIFKFLKHKKEDDKDDHLETNH
ncbi:MAG: signal peptidase I [Acholeplasmataceae bacterium]